MSGRIDRLHALRAQALEGGGERRVEAQHAKGKLTARERVELLVDRQQEAGEVRHVDGPFERVEQARRSGGGPPQSGCFQKGSYRHGSIPMALAAYYKPVPRPKM